MLNVEKGRFKAKQIGCTAGAKPFEECEVKFWTNIQRKRSSQKSLDDLGN